MKNTSPTVYLNHLNCIIVDDDDVSKLAIEQVVKQMECLTLIKICSSPIEAISILNKEPIDLIFLDIEMPEMSGFDMLKALSKRPQVIITTSHKEYALNAFDFNVVDYLVKPITLPRLIKAVAKIKDNSKFHLNTAKDFFFIKKNGVFIKVPVKDIIRVEALGDYVTIHCNNDKHILHTPLKTIESNLPSHKFMRVHRSHIVNIDTIKQVEYSTVHINEVSVPVGAAYREDFMKRLNTI